LNNRLHQIGAALRILKIYGSPAAPAGELSRSRREGFSLGVHDAFDDSVLGHVTFDEGHKEWKLAVVVGFREVPGSIVPEDHRLPLQEQGLEEIRECIAWVRDNELAIRQHITDEMFDGWLSGWYDEEFDTVVTPEGFQEAISLSGFSVLEDRVASLYYNDGELYGGHSIVLSVGAGGHYKYPPQIWG
jgi:hypothetical protein